MGLMEIQQQFLDIHKKLADYLIRSVHDRFDGQVMSICCIGCKTGNWEDARPTFAINRPGHYVCRLRQDCQKCKRRVTVVPVEAKWIRTSSLAAESPKEVELRRFLQLLLPQEERTEEQCRPIELFCIVCQENTIIMRGGVSSYIDHTPRWTLGEIRPLCVERQCNCQTCRTHGRAARFLPINSAIPSILPRVLAELAKSYGGYDCLILSKLLDAWPQSQRASRGLRQGLSIVPGNTSNVVQARSSVEDQRPLASLRYTPSYLKHKSSIQYMASTGELAALVREPCDITSREHVRIDQAKIMASTPLSRRKRRGRSEPELRNFKQRRVAEF
jgi:hypothetical protein